MVGDGGSRRVVVVEDALDVQTLVAGVLGQAGWEVTLAETGVAGLQAVRETDPDLVTLDLSLPDIDGLEVCRRLREFTDAYVVMLTGRTTEVDRLLGLQIGADDYLTKPFSPRELVTRVEVLMRRPRSHVVAGSTEDVVEVGGLHVDLARRIAQVDGLVIALTKTEFDLLTELVRGDGRVLTRRALLEQVWGSDWEGGEHTVDVHVTNLRHKLGSSPGSAPYVETVRGVGYRLAR
jgi:two-component system OmpR family response regulator